MLLISRLFRVSVFVCLCTTMTAFAELQLIISGSNPGEIYILGPIQTEKEKKGLYRSFDSGQSIELIDSVANIYYEYYSGLLDDVEDDVFYAVASIPIFSFFRVTGQAQNWQMMAASNYYHLGYASGVIPGEIYRRMEDDYERLERSDNSGMTYTPCASAGIGDSSSVYSAALGTEPGEVYIWGYHSEFFRSLNYAESFTYLGEFWEHDSINYATRLINGCEPGEVYVIHDYGYIWRLSEYGRQVDELFHPNYPTSVMSQN